MRSQDRTAEWSAAAYDFALPEELVRPYVELDGTRGTLIYVDMTGSVWNGPSMFRFARVIREAPRIHEEAALLKRADRYRGAFLCDGVNNAAGGLGLLQFLFTDCPLQPHGEDKQH